MNFRSAYYDEDGLLESSKKKIIFKYLKGWFIIDLLTVIPFDYIEANSGGTATSILRATK